MKVIIEMEITGDIDEDSMTDEEKFELIDEFIELGADKRFLNANIHSIEIKNK